MITDSSCKCVSAEIWFTHLGLEFYKNTIRTKSNNTLLKFDVICKTGTVNRMPFPKMTLIKRLNIMAPKSKTRL